MKLLELINAIIHRQGCTLAEAAAAAWRILNEYDDTFRIAALELAKGDIPTVEVAGINIKSVEDISGAKGFDALELLRIISLDEMTGKDILFRIGAHDTRR